MIWQEMIKKSGANFLKIVGGEALSLSKNSKQLKTFMTQFGEGYGKKMVTNNIDELDNFIIERSVGYSDDFITALKQASAEVVETNIKIETIVSKFKASGSNDFAKFISNNKNVGDLDDVTKALLKKRGSFSFKEKSFFKKNDIPKNIVETFSFKTEKGLQTFLNAEAKKVVNNEKSKIFGSKLSVPFAKKGIKDSNSFSASMINIAKERGLPPGVTDSGLASMISNAVTKAEKVAFAHTKTGLARTVKFTAKHPILVGVPVVGADYAFNDLGGTKYTLKGAFNLGDAALSGIDNLFSDDDQKPEIKTDKNDVSAPTEDISDKVIEQVLSGDLTGAAMSFFSSPSGLLDSNILGKGSQKLSQAYNGATKFLENMGIDPEYAKIITGIAAFLLLKTTGGFLMSKSGAGNLPVVGGLVHGVGGLGITIGSILGAFKIADMVNQPSNSVLETAVAAPGAAPA